MKIYTKVDMRLDGEHVPAGTQVEVEKELATLLLGTDRASLEPVAVAQVADPLAPSVDEGKKK